MNFVSNGTRMRAALQTILMFLILAGSSMLQGQTATDIQVASTVLQPSVYRLGVNFGDNGYWDSGQMMKNLIFENPGFEGLRYRVIFRCTAVTANTCMDDNQYNAQPAGYWNGASYLVLSGNAAGTTGTIVSNTAASTCKSCGPTLTFDKNVNLAVGDYFSAVNYFPGAGDAGWADDTGSGGTITTETNDISPNSPGQQAMLLSASATGQYAKVTQGFDTWSGLSFIQMNGNFAITFRAKGVGGTNKLNVSALRLQSGVPNWLNQTITLTNAWQDYTLIFTANETGAGLGPIQLNFLAQGSSVELDDVSLQQTNSDATNTTVFRDDVVNALKQLNPGTIRMMAAGAALGSDLPNQLQVPFARYRMGFNADGTSYPNIAYGIHEFLQLCQAVGADPWITIPTATTPAEMTEFIQYLTGTGSDAWSTLRISRGQTQPWTTVFNKIHLELGNETWNGSFKGESMNYPAYPQWANQVFGAARQTTGFVASKFDLVLSGLAATPGYNAPMLTYSTQHDSFDIAPYLLFSANDESQALQFGAMFAEPEVFDSAGGEVYNNMAVGAAAPSATGSTTAVSVYETNLGTMIGNITKAELDNLTPSIGAGLAHADHMLQMMRIGMQYQNAFALPQYEYRRSDGSLTRLWGLVVDMGTTNRRRPQFWTQAMANAVIGGSMLTTAHTGANPTWNQPLSSDSVVLNGAHELQSFAFVNDGVVSVIVFNLSQTDTLPVTFSGTNAPSGTVTMTQITSANITDNNEFSNVVLPATQTLSGFNPATGLSLPPFSMTVLSMASSTVQAPSFSVAGGTYTTPQTLTIADTTPGAAIYYTTDGSTPTTSSAQYAAPLFVDKTMTIQAIATPPSASSNASIKAASALEPSAVTSATYVMSFPAAATPAFSVAAGQYAAAQTVSIADATAGATIYYTTDGTVPATSSAVYTGPIKVSATQTVKAIASATYYVDSAVASAAYTIMTAAATPTFSVPTGTYTSTQTIAMASATPGATIYYTTNGSTPTVYSNKYTAAISISATETVQAFATAANYNNSAVASATYTINHAAGTPAFSVPSGTYTSAQAVTITDTTGGALIYYTTDGSTPTTSSKKYAAPITVSTSETIKAIATATGYPNSAVGSASYTINAKTTATPTFSLASGTYSATQTVSLSDATSGAVIYYTTNGATPTTSSTKYTAAIKVSATETIKAIAVATNYTDSAVASASYTITTVTATPVFSVAAGTYSSAQTVSITDATSGAVIYYTTNGATPTTSSTKYTAAIKVSATETLKAIATAASHTNSAVASASYTISTVTATPTFSVAAGTYTAAQTVTLADATSGATIYYTINGATPTTSSTKYTAAIKVSTTETLKAIATAASHTTSAVASATYTITPSTGSKVVAAPTFSVPAGTYSAKQTVALADTTSGATIYYTTNGSTPTTSSTKYTAAIAVSASETIKAIAALSSTNTSAVVTAAYTITPVTTGGTGAFTSGEMVLYGSAKLKGTTIQLTDGGAAEIATAWYAKKVGVGSFTADFTFQVPSSNADGFTFTVQNDPKGTWASGGNGAALGYAGIKKSVAIKFDLYNGNNATEVSSTGMLQNGASPATQWIDMSKFNISLHTGHVMHVVLVYDGTALKETVTDMTTKAVYAGSYTVNIPSILGSTSGYIGFTASTGGKTAVQNILTLSYSGLTTAQKAK